jgi:hypothetical protein
MATRVELFVVAVELLALQAELRSTSVNSKDLLVVDLL